MSRLLFAAARGARLQVMADNNWYGITLIYMPFRRDARAIRIHPDDEHLQYGPISTALREAAEGKLDPQTEGSAMAFVVYARHRGLKDMDDLHRSLLLLILAEALADEGL